MAIVSGLVSKFRYIVSPLLPALWVPLIYTTLTALDLITGFWEWGDRTWDEQDKLPNVEEVFDFIIVGAGSAGCAVAYRLSQEYSVLLIEAGGEPNPLQFIPAFAPFLTGLDALDWKHKTVSQKYGSLNSINGESSWSVGRGIGGTGNLNYMIHLRGHPRDFDNWARLTGDPSWSYEGVLPYFKKLEDHEEGADPRYHGFGGPLRIEKPDGIGLAPEYVRAGAELGYPSVDLNAPFNEGFDIIRYPIKYGIRQAPFQGYIKPIRHRPTLTIRKFSLATRILFKEGNVAYGVEYLRHQERRVAYAKKEVILSAGAITSPKLLMLSGIGPAAHLTSLGIPVRQDLPVGKHLQDHLAIFQGPYFINQPRTVFIDRDLTPSAFVQWFTGGRGILSSPGSTAVGIISSSFAKARGEGNWPDQLLYYFGLSVSRNYGTLFSTAFSLKLDEMNDYFRHAIGIDSFILAISAARPLSKGYIELGGSNINDKLVIDPNYFGDPNQIDLKVTIEALKTALVMMENTTTFGEELGCRFTTESYPACKHIPFRTDEYWECYARQFSITLHHPVGTCGMGRVVDTQLRVYGTQRLRVIDASIQPEIVTTNTQASTLMIGEKGADIVLNYWKQKELQENNLVKDYSGEYSQIHLNTIPKTTTGNSTLITYYSSN